MLYRALRLVAGVALRWYYREVAVIGAERVPARAPVLFAVNHPNALVDALVVGWVMPRRIRITAKAVLFDNPVLGAFLRHVGVIPLRRASDELAKRRSGAAVQTVGEAADPARNAAAFDEIIRALDGGAAVLIFPEGRSHDAPALAPLKTGPARIALAARGAGKASGLRIVPIGLLFESKADVRSRVVAVVGDPIDPDALATDGGGESTTALTACIADRLRAVVLAAPTPERLRHVQWLARHVAAILAPTAPRVGEIPSLGEEYAIAMRVARGLDRMGEMPDRARATAEAVLRSVETFAAELEAAGVAPTDAAISLRRRHGARFVVRELALLAIVAPVALWGRLTHWLPFRAARRLAMRDVTAQDQPAMRTIVLGLAFVLASYVVQGALVWWLAGGWWAALYVMTLPIAADADVRYTDRLRTAVRRMRTWLRFRDDPALAERLAERRGVLAKEIRALDAQVGID